MLQVYPAQPVCGNSNLHCCCCFDPVKDLPGQLTRLSDLDDLWLGPDDWLPQDDSLIWAARDGVVRRENMIWQRLNCFESGELGVGGARLCDHTSQISQPEEAWTISFILYLPED